VVGTAPVEALGGKLEVHAVFDDAGIPGSSPGLANARTAVEIVSG
jgi:hypothetical protein